ncbi:MAG: triose-phosphate isomerase [Bacteroidales bacterium]|nr:triose-phosphate isomerase [Bacteroidales bacterium]
MRRNIVAGNWKMNNSFDEAEELVTDIAEYLEKNPVDDAEIIICPPFIYLEMTTDVSAESQFAVGAQNLCAYDKGAYTGEISAAMLAGLDVEYCIIGHSERRKYFGDTDEIIAAKIQQALKENISPIFCCGESLAEREAGNYKEVVQTQIEEALANLSADEMDNVIIAYEPVWAIGTGLNATPAQAQEMHAYIREILLENFSIAIANNTTILYGGSCNAGNAKEIFAQPDVDGGLIGGASLKANEFIQIITAF